MRKDAQVTAEGPTEMADVFTSFPVVQFDELKIEVTQKRKNRQNRKTEILDLEDDEEGLEDE